MYNEHAALARARHILILRKALKYILAIFKHTSSLRLLALFLTISYSESAYPITPVESLKAILYDYFGISVYLAYFIFI